MSSDPAAPLPTRRPVTALEDDACLAPFLPALRRRRAHARAVSDRLTGGRTPLADVAAGHTHFGLHRRPDGWVFREWAPNATAITLIGDGSQWQERPEWALRRAGGDGTWELAVPPGALRHGDYYRLKMHWPGGAGDRVPAYARRVVQDPRLRVFNAQVWAPEPPYAWRHPGFRYTHAAPLIYEAHVGMAQEREGMGTYDEFRRLTLPRIADAGYNTVQLMALLQHPYYGSFGYHVTSFFAASSWFGTPDELKALIDDAHGLGLGVIIDIVHSHAANNEVEGLSRFDGTLWQYFHDLPRGRHDLWDSRCFDYGKDTVLHFLLSNCRFWLDEYRVDGFRFDGVTSMLYHHHGLGTAFTGYGQYFDGSVDEDALAYLTLANQVIHAVRPDAITIAEDVSGMPGLAAPFEDGGCGFDFRLGMGVTDTWVRYVREVRDEQWHLGHLWHELTNHRSDERVISYAESHDQALVGSKTLIFELIDAAMYGFMRAGDRHSAVERGIALHKMIRLATLATAGHGYMNFMGNEFGHPEWIDFPREGNNWSYWYARRQWRLRDDPGLKYHYLADFDRAMVRLVRAHATLERDAARLLLIHEDDKVFAFARGDLLFAFNFHPTRSVADYALDVPDGAYERWLDTDENRFGGYGMLAADQRYHTQALDGENGNRRGIRVYLPCRVALVLRRV